METKTHSDTDAAAVSSPVVPYNVDSSSNSSDSHSTVREDPEQKNPDNPVSTGTDQKQEPSQDESVSKLDVSDTSTTSPSSSTLAPTVPPAEPEPPSSQPPNELTNASAEVRELAIMFPQIPQAILEAVLAAHQNDPGECVSDLLAMNDPTWKPTAEDLMKSDEALARQLAREEEQQSIPTPQPIPQINVPYQPRIKKNPSNRSPMSTYEQRTENPSNGETGQSSSNLTGKDEIQKIADEFSRMAETGKKTVSTWLNKAKAKIQELQQPSADLPSDPTSHENEYQASQPAIVISGAEYGTSPSNPKRSSRISPALPYASRYDSAPPTRTPADTATGSVTNNPSLPRTSTPTVEPKRGDEMMNVHDASSKSKQVATGTAIGNTNTLIPNKPLTSAQRTRDEDEESLEYTRNPFEDED
ncbi:uncharacterized protein MELLADRAFT_118315 [Melampsora larici-populina 98AG31]|uniref:CUE domain-containing protein n=1 Tax=Melampsora larici-populina (strain 98AG31 / pathotype 3-4-7) TaxID=747676 RepID=F4S7I3_MELLP|nr:uncharacterized protein MELLADRAFT_118315 [Melampsora larici-populina 98AG31]EGF99422.1 hypothetical protein MELLADRAFT_118315 [Melampsora larici-populina 98AG31]